MSDFVTRACNWCGNDGPVYSDSFLCEQCDGDVVRCNICDEDQHIDDLCRHVFRNSDYEWSGAGIGLPHEGNEHAIKSSFFALLSRMPLRFAFDLRAAISASKFHTWLVAPMIGGGGILTLYGFPDHARQRRWGKLIIEIGESETAEQYSDGFNWLVSLYDDRSLDANRLTVEWIDQWRQTPLDGRT